MPNIQSCIDGSSADAVVGRGGQMATKRQTKMFFFFLLISRYAAFLLIGLPMSASSTLQHLSKMGSCVSKNITALIRLRTNLPFFYQAFFFFWKLPDYYQYFISLQAHRSPRVLLKRVWCGLWAGCAVLPWCGSHAVGWWRMTSSGERKYCPLTISLDILW